LTALGSVIGRQVAIWPKRLDTYSVIPHPWGAVVGPPSVLKSPALREGVRFLRDLAKAAEREYAAAINAYLGAAEGARARRDALKAAMKTAAKGGDESTLLE